MPRIAGFGSSKLKLVIAALIVLFAFTPISRALLASADGSFAPTPFSSLELRSPSDPASGFQVGDLVPVRLTNHTGSTKTYHWSATQHGVVVSLGEETLRNGRGVNINVPTSYGRSGALRIGLTGTDVFLTVALQKSQV
jgi:hypothetical protein